MLSIFWYLLVSVIEFHYEQLKLLPHLGCILDNYDNISTHRPPLPSFQYNLLHQKLTVLNCCIEERRNNSRYHSTSTMHDSNQNHSNEKEVIEKDMNKNDSTYMNETTTTTTTNANVNANTNANANTSSNHTSHDFDLRQCVQGDSIYNDECNQLLGEENSSDSEISFFSDSEATPRHDESNDTPATSTNFILHHRHTLSATPEHPAKPEGKGILNWSGWFLVGTDIPCFIPITKDKDILTVGIKH